jgi:hypothetical protein
MNAFTMAKTFDSHVVNTTQEDGNETIRQDERVVFSCAEREIMTTREMELNQRLTAFSIETCRREVQSLYRYSVTYAVLLRVGRQLLAAVLCVLVAPMSQLDLYAQQPSPAQGSGDSQTSGQQAQPSAQALTPDQLDQLVAPIALYPDALVAQILGASTYPTQIVEANRWIQKQGKESASKIADAANKQSWDPSVKALTAFPSVLAQLDKNLDWTTNLGNAYYNQPKDVMAAVQAMRKRAQASGKLKSTSQQNVSTSNGSVVIAPANPSVVYVPEYNPWVVYGAPVVAYPGFAYAPAPGFAFGAGLAIGFGVGIGIGAFGGFGWGWHNWRCGWNSRTVVFNHTTFITHSRTVINRGVNRPGGPGRYAGARGTGGRGAVERANFNHQAGHVGGQAARADTGFHDDQRSQASRSSASRSASAPRRASAPRHDAGGGHR